MGWLGCHEEHLPDWDISTHQGALDIDDIRQSRNIGALRLLNWTVAEFGRV
jgi:hypothetical protein